MSLAEVGKRYKCTRCGLPKAGHTCLNPPNPDPSGPSASVITGLLHWPPEVVVVATEQAPVYYANTVVQTPEIYASIVAEGGSNRGYRCGKCGQPKKGHVCPVLDSDHSDRQWSSTVERRAPLSSAGPVESGPKQDTACDSKRRRLDAGPPSAAAGAGTVAVEAEAEAVEAVAVEAVAVEAVAVEAVAVEASAWDPQQEAALHVAAEASAAFQLPTDDAELAAAEASAEQRVRRLRDDLERVEAAMISAQAELTELRRQRGARGAADMAAALTPMPEPAPTAVISSEAATSSFLAVPAPATAAAGNLGMSYRCKRCGQPKKGHVCTNPAGAVANAWAETPLGELASYSGAAARHAAWIGLGQTAVGVHKRPRGRPPSNKTWDTVAGRWVPIDPSGAEVVVAAEAQRGDMLVEVVAEVAAEVEGAEAEAEEEAEAEGVAGAALAPPLDRVRSGFSYIEEID
jgi:DNA-directed RNA polymerase subunit RPC12/RpoP